ncbi:MAG: GAF domain-containing sensor histidine kinase, partial [Dehalococcoidia bacterium]|nr:GAF domain-containing sensor histidine kinase [Dehalococcoidia bacterium]
DERTQMLCYTVHHDLSSKYAQEMCLRLGEGVAGKVAETGRSILLEDISSEPNAARPDLISMEGLKAFISVPLRAKDNVLGVMNVASHLPHRFTKEDMYLLHSIADQLGTAIEQARLHEGLEKGKKRYQELARQILITQEEERRRIARELHDETSQTLSGLALNLQALVQKAEMLGIDDAEFKTRLEKAHTLAVQTGSEVSRLIADLRPTLLDTLGLVPAIRQYAGTTLTPLGINFSFQAEGIDRPLPPEVELGFFRWVQGAIGNIIQHSQAKNATISLKLAGNDLELRITDDGEGFDVSQITRVERSGRGAGLFGMKERIALLGGSCSVQSQPGQGTRVTGRIPLTRSTANAEDKSADSR